jgi:hypothetical protein
MHPRLVSNPCTAVVKAEVRAWVSETNLATAIRASPGIKDVEVSFCPGEGWLAARYIFDDLDDMVAYLGSDSLKEAKYVV